MKKKIYGSQDPLYCHIDVGVINAPEFEVQLIQFRFNTQKENERQEKLLLSVLPSFVAQQMIRNIVNDLYQESKSLRSAIFLRAIYYRLYPYHLLPFINLTKSSLNKLSKNLQLISLLLKKTLIMKRLNFF